MSKTLDFNFTCDTEGATYTPWTDGWAIGYHVRYSDGGQEYIYLNPLSKDSEENVFVYLGEHGKPALDEALYHYTL